MRCLRAAAAAFVCFVIFFLGKYITHTDDADRYEKASKNNFTGYDGGAWTVCTHISHYLNFDYGLGTFIVYQLRPFSVLEFGCGIGIYLQFIVTRNPQTRSAVGIEPIDMSAAGVFGKDIRNPTQIMGNILSNSRREERLEMKSSELVYSIEVAEHIPYDQHPELVRFLSSKTKKYLLFSSAHPGQEGVGHIPESMLPKDTWIKRFENEVLFYLPRLSEMLANACGTKNRNHRMNAFVMGTDPDLDTAELHPQVQKTPEGDKHNSFAQTLFPKVDYAINVLLSRCGTNPNLRAQ